MRNVIIVGTGGCASEVTFYIENHNSVVKPEDQLNIQGYIDYEEVALVNYKKYQYKAPLLCDIPSYIPKPGEELLIAIMNVHSRKKEIDKLEAKNATIGSFVHHSAIIPENRDIGIGSIVFPFCVIEKYAKIGNYNLLTTYSFISHDCAVGNNNFFSTAGIAGNVKVGDDNYFGLRSSVVPGIEIGNNNIIQAGMMIDKNIKDDTTVFYRYKEQVLAIPKTK
jgi:UDP-3-O-[3-hydroxymyristoyl] glucosamine N-acyltransferase